MSDLDDDSRDVFVRRDDNKVPSGVEILSSHLIKTVELSAVCPDFLISDFPVNGISHST